MSADKTRSEGSTQDSASPSMVSKDTIVLPDPVDPRTFTKEATSVRVPRPQLAFSSEVNLSQVVLFVLGWEMKDGTRQFQDMESSVSFQLCVP